MTITYKSHALSREEFCKIKSAEFAEQYPKENITPEVVDRMISACQHPERPWEEESSHDLDQAMENVCQCLEDQPQELEVVPEGQWTPNSQEAAMLETIRTASLQSGTFSELREKFEFGADLKDFRLKEGAIATPFDYSKILGMGWRMAESGRFLVADSVAVLYAMGFENVLLQGASMLKLEYSTISNWHRLAQRVKGEDRNNIAFSVAQEIALPRYSKDEEENSKAIKELLDKAKQEGWNSTEARAHSQLKRGKTSKSSKKDESPQYVCILNGEYFLTNDQPAIEPGLIMIDIRNLEYLVDDGQKVSMHSIPVR